MEQFKGFDWTRTRQVILTVDPKLFANGQTAHEYINRHKLIPGFIRNIERGKKINVAAEFKKESGRKAQPGDVYEYELKKNEVFRFEKTRNGWVDLRSGEMLGRIPWATLYRPVKVTNWKWFKEWHKNGFCHYHLFIETTIPGRAGMIGGDCLRHYWPWADWVKETYIKNQGHWDKLTGYFDKHGYFDPGKNGDHNDLRPTKKAHQAILPGWAQDNYGTHKKIRRSCGKVLHRDLSAAGYFDRKRLETRDIDLRTGEVKRLRPKRILQEKTYKTIFASCGARSRVRIYGGKSFIDGVFSIPYKDLKAKFPAGEFQERQGYAFSLSYPDLLELFDHVERINAFSIHGENSELKRLMDKWHDYRISQGYYAYKRVYGG